MTILLALSFSACAQTLGAHESEDDAIHATQAAQIDAQAKEVAEIKAQVADLKARVIAALPEAAAESDTAAAVAENATAPAPAPEPAPAIPAVAPTVTQ
jgi:cell division protein FtsB